MAEQRVLVVDDDPKIRDVIRRSLESEGFAVDEAPDVVTLMSRIQSAPYALITLDIRLPDGSGFEAARMVRARTTTPIIMITGQGDVVDKVVGLEMGAEDYIAKPFHVREFLARVRAVLRRPPSGERSDMADDEEAWQADGLTIFPERRALVGSNGDEISLTSAEYELLMALVSAKGRAVTRDTLLDAMYGRNADAPDRAVDNAVARMRKRLPEGLIKTIRLVGYQLGVPVSKRRLCWPESASRAN